MEEKLDWQLRLLGLGFMLGLFGMIWLYVREFPVLSNTIGVKNLVIGSFLAAALLASGLVFWFRERFTPWQRHWTELVFLVFPLLFFAPLFGSLLNRAGGATENERFEFVSERGFFASGYGLLKGEEVKPSGWLLTVRERGKLLTFKYKSQAFYPLTKPGEPVLLPVKTGLFGVRVVQLR